MLYYTQCVCILASLAVFGNVEPSTAFVHTTRSANHAQIFSVRKPSFLSALSVNGETGTSGDKPSNPDDGENSSSGAKSTRATRLKARTSKPRTKSSPIAVSFENSDSKDIDPFDSKSTSAKARSVWERRVKSRSSRASSSKSSSSRGRSVHGSFKDDSLSASEKYSVTPGEAIQRLGIKTGPTVWTEFARLAQKYDPVNLGQGFPDWLPPKFAVDSLVEAVRDGAKSPHQYTRPAGHPNLVMRLAQRYSLHLYREVSALDEVAVTVGASQALYLSLQTLINPGDEVILFEPFFDLYVNQVKLAGGTPVYVPLTFVPYDTGVNVTSSGEWILEEEQLAKAITNRTKTIILNSPHNPTGKIFSKAEMEIVAKYVERAGPDCVVLSDEVYKYIIHAPPKQQENIESPLCRGHIHFATLPGMWEKTITISSAGKTFSATGWQVGWCVGPKALIRPIHQLLPYVQFCASTVTQEALARALSKADEPYEGYESYYQYLKIKYIRKRDLLAYALKAAGFEVPDYEKTPGGGFFIFARAGDEIIKNIPQKYMMVKNHAAPGGVARQDWALCRWMTEEIGVLVIPSCPFFSVEKVEEGASDSFIRVAFCKSDETIAAAADALMKLRTLTTGIEYTPKDSLDGIGTQDFEGYRGYGAISGVDDADQYAGYTGVGVGDSEGFKDGALVYNAGYQPEGYNAEYQQDGYNGGDGYDTGYQQEGYNTGYQQEGYNNGYQQDGYNNNGYQNEVYPGYQQDTYNNYKQEELINDFQKKAQDTGYQQQGYNNGNQQQYGNNGQSNGQNNGYKGASSGYSEGGYNGYNGGAPGGKSGFATSAPSGYPEGNSGYTGGTNGYPDGSNGYMGGTSGYTDNAVGYTGNAGAHVGGNSGYIAGTSGYTEGSSGYRGGTNGYTDGNHGYPNGSTGGSSGYADGNSGLKGGGNGYE